MSKWGVFDKTSPPHVMPVDKDGFAINGHTVSDQCWCKPTVTQENRADGTRAVVVHHDKGRGGRDA